MFISSISVLLLGRFALYNLDYMFPGSAMALRILTFNLLIKVYNSYFRHPSSAEVVPAKQGS